MEEEDRLNEIAINSLYSHGVMTHAIKHCYSIISKYVNLANVLELGAAEGVMTEFLQRDSKSLTVIEGSQIFSDNLKKKYKNISVIHSLFEEYQPTKKYDFIILSHVLEHVSDPLLVLKLATSWLTPKGKIFAAVPNSHSIHRQAGVLMGLLISEESLNSLDIHHGHRRVFSAKGLHQLFVDAELRIVKSGGYWLKPISNKQIDEHWSNDMINSSMILGEKFPDIAAEIYILADKI